MAVKSLNKNSKGAKSPKLSQRPVKARESRTAVMSIIAFVVVVLLGFEAVSLFKTPEAEIFLTAQVIGQFSGSDQPCGKFSAWDVAAAGNDRIVVTDQENGRVLFFDREGKFLKVWGKKGEKPQDLKEPSGICSGTKGDVYFVDAWNSKIVGLDDKANVGLTVPLTHGFYGPRGVAFDGNYFYLADTGTHRIAKVSPQGDLVASWGSGKQGPGKGEFDNPRSLKVDAKGNIVVADFENNRVQVLDPAGKFILVMKAGSKVSDVAVDGSGRIFAASMDGGFVKVYSPAGKYLGQLKDPKGSGDPFHDVSGMNFTPDGVLLMTANDLVTMVRVP